jgi:predicted Fe-Mo cluster-binding NifX family protein
MMKIAVTSQNFKTITGHAGKTRRFLVYTENEESQWRESERLDLPKEMSMHEFRGTDHPLDALDILITAGCGDGFIRKMSARGVKVITTSETSPFNAVNDLMAGIPLPPAVAHDHKHDHATD